MDDVTALVLAEAEQIVDAEYRRAMRHQVTPHDRVIVDLLEWIEELHERLREPVALAQEPAC